MGREFIHVETEYPLRIVRNHQAGVGLGIDEQSLQGRNGGWTRGSGTVGEGGGKTNSNKGFCS